MDICKGVDAIYLSSQACYTEELCNFKKLPKQLFILFFHESPFHPKPRIGKIFSHIVFHFFRPYAVVPLF
jgi:hypothetical protein